MIITISGLPGSGKTTTAKILSEKLNLKRYSVGNFRREKAKKLGLTLEEFNKLGEKDSFTDKEADDWQIEIGKREDNFIIDGRLSYHFIPNSIKIFLSVSPEVGAERIMLERREEEKHQTINEAVKSWKTRVNSDKKRYKKYYNLNPNDSKNYDLVIDTSSMEKQEVIDKILRFIEENGEK